jgi:transposase-like protein
MERDWLEEQLDAGRSIEAIAREVGRHPSTVGYWVRKHGLRSTYVDRHTARGGIARDELAALVEAGLAIRAMAAQLGVSYATVRHWLRVHDLRTAWSAEQERRKAARAIAATRLPGTCPVHGDVLLAVRTERFRCERCAREAVASRRRAVKAVLVAEAGGACVLCGYDEAPAALHFHHLDPAEKAFALAAHGVSRSLDRARAEAAKCVLLCANCHAAVESGVRELPSSTLGSRPREASHGPG